jgi:putative cardiolipin synthase
MSRTIETTNTLKRLGVALGVAVIAMLILSNLTGLPDNSGRQRASVVADTGSTRLGQRFGPAKAAHRNLNGVIELPHGRDAFAARAVLALEADRSIDTQYYMWHQDTVGRLLVYELIAAADRGVRVRLLVDDMYGTDGQVTWLAMDVHQNIEVRLFAPYSRRQPKYLQFLTRFTDVNARMHSKTFTVDNQATVVGGRNIGDEYFDADPDLAFSDNDVMIVGPAVGEVSTEFDDYWNGDYAYPVSTLHAAATDTDLQALRDESAELHVQSSTMSYLQAVRDGSFATSLRDGSAAFHWSPGQIIHDSWRKRDQSYEGWHEDLLITQLNPHIEAATSEIVMISPYFVPGDEAVKVLCEHARRGVSVKILTNSLASNDVAAVHAGYSNYRVALLRCGVQLYELNEHLRGAERRAFTWLPTVKKSSLHAKTMIFDRKKMFVGSFNFDPRSLYLNTEIGLVFEQPEIAGPAAVKFGENIERFAFRVELLTDARGRESLRWHGTEEGKPVTYDDEPYAGNGTKAAVWLLRRLPIEGML